VSALNGGVALLVAAFAATTPALAGALLNRTSFGWPLVIGGLMKSAYDLLLLAQPIDRR